MRARILSPGLTAALVAGVLIATAPAASADVGDQKSFPLPNGVQSFGMAAAADGSLWLSPYSGTALINLSMSGDYALHPLKILGKPVAGNGIAQAPDGRIWFAERTSFSLVNTDPSGNDSKQTFPATKTEPPAAVTTGPDGNIWFTTATTIRRLNPNGSVSIFPTSFKNITNIQAGPGNWLAFAAYSTKAIGKITTDGVVTTIPLPDNSYTVTVAGDGTLWAGGPTTVYRVAPSGAVTPFAVKTNGGSVIALAPDGSAWAAGQGDKSLTRISASGEISQTTLKADASHAIALGADGNMWVLTGASVIRVLTGITPASTSAPVVSGGANAVGTTLTSSKGDWKFLPASQTFQWQRCTANDPGSCTPINGATDPKYTITDADQGMWLQSTVSAKNLNGASKPVGSALFQVAPKATAPTQPTQPTAPAPVTGVGKVTLAPGVTATLSGPSSVKRKAKKTYRVTFTAPQPRGTVKLSLVNAAGAEAYVLTPATNLKGTKKTAYASRTARIPRSVQKGAYTLVAVYTPTTGQATTYPVVTLTKPLTLR